MLETRWGECQICKQVRLLYSVIGKNNGKLWAGWICGNCLEKQHEKDWGKKDGEEGTTYSLCKLPTDSD